MGPGIGLGVGLLLVGLAAGAWLLALHLGGPGRRWWRALRWAHGLAGAGVLVLAFASGVAVWTGRGLGRDGLGLLVSGAGLGLYLGFLVWRGQKLPGLALLLHAVFAGFGALALLALVVA